MKSYILLKPFLIELHVVKLWGACWDCNMAQGVRTAKFRADPLNPISPPRVPKPSFSGPGALQNLSGTSVNASGVLRASNSHVEMVETIVISIESKHFVIFDIFWKLFCQPFGENTLSKKNE